MTFADEKYNPDEITYPIFSDKYSKKRLEKKFINLMRIMMVRFM